MVMALDGMVCSRAPQIVYSSAVLIPVSRIAPLRTVPRNRRRAVSEQEFPPPRHPARSYRPDRDDEDPPPWADLPPVRPARTGRPASGGYPAAPGRSGAPAGRPAGAPGGRHGAPAGPGGPGGPGTPRRPSGPAARPDDGPGARPDGPGGRQDGPGGYGGSGRSAGSGAPRRASGPSQDEQVPGWAQWAGPEADGEDHLPPPRSRDVREPRER